MVNMTNIHQFVRDARQRAKLKQDTLGTMVGCTGTYINRIETGKTVPSLEMSLKLECVLRIPRHQLAMLVAERMIMKRLQEVIDECAKLGIHVKRHLGVEMRQQVENEISVGHR